VKADPAAQVRLLDLQAADTELAQLAHRREHLPELAALAASDEQAGRLRSDVLELQAQLDDVADDQRRLENEVDTVQTRAKRDNERLTAGGLPAKDLEGLQHEITTLARRQSTLEDDLLEVMERRETLDAEQATLTRRQDALTAERADLEAKRDATFVEIDAAAERRKAERAVIVAEIPADLLALYDKIRASSGGVGAAMLRQRRCEGCHLELAGSELNAVRAAAPDAIVRCDNCRRILVRTAESGL
jgi:predicted  nucleic acid-binding Zn-ribbon protein